MHASAPRRSAPATTAAGAQHPAGGPGGRGAAGAAGHVAGDRGSRTRPESGAGRLGVRVSRGPGRVRALDGLRGVAVLAVLVFHAWPDLLPGGFVGVDVFLVLSGFLITTGLVRSVDGGRGLGLRAFWTRRVRRLLPAVAAALVGGTALAWLAAGELPARLGAQWLGALTYTSNWVLLSQGSDYFSGASPPLFEHLWSLAIEEQFYLLWPLLLLGILTLFWPRAATWEAAARADLLRALAVLGLALASAAGMVIGSAVGVGRTRLYFGTDTHAFGLLLGAAVALWLTHARRPEDGGPDLPTPAVRTGIAWALFAGLVASFRLVDGDADAPFRGALAGLSLLVAVLVVHVVQGDRRDSLSRFLSADPLRWWGRRSYAAYLWHWPLLVILRLAVPPGSPAWIEHVGAGVVLLVTAGVADLSTRLLEEPVLRHGFRGALARAGRSVRAAARTERGRLAVAGAALALVGVTGAAAAAVAHSPSQTALERDVAAGEAALQQAQGQAHAAPTAPLVGGAAPAAQPSGEATPDGGAPTVLDPTRALGLGDPAVSRPAFTLEELTGELPPSRLGGRVSVVGDSVALSAAPALLAELPGVRVDGKVGRGLAHAAPVLETMRDEGRLTDVVVLGLGANGTADPAHLRRIMAAVGPERLLVLVVPHGPDAWVPDAQERMASLAREHPGQVVLADWEAVSAHVGRWSADGVHPGEEGQDMYARLVRLTIEERMGGR